MSDEQMSGGGVTLSIEQYRMRVNWGMLHGGWHASNSISD